MFGLFPEKENSTCQTRQVSYNSSRPAILPLTLASGEGLKENPEYGYSWREIFSLGWNEGYMAF